MAAVKSPQQPQSQSQVFLPEEDPQDVGHQQHQTHICGEALCILGPADVSVLWDVGDDPTEHHGSSCDPRHQLIED